MITIVWNQRSRSPGTRTGPAHSQLQHAHLEAAGDKLADGTVLELYGPTNEFHAFFTTGPVVAFRVDNFDVTRQAMLAVGVNFIGDVQHAGGVSWQHFYCPDGTVLEISGPGDGTNPLSTST